MPLYECYCEHCDAVVEVLAALSASSAKSHPCPACGRRARRMLSAVTFGRRGTATPDGPSKAPSPDGRPDVTQLKVPPPAQLCWMDQPTSSRYAAYLHGRGTEYDDTVAARTERQKQRGTPAEAKPAHQHSHSPLADPAIYARRRAAAAKHATKADSAK